MPIHLPAISRRQFISGAAGVIGSCVLVQKGYPRDVDSDLNRFALVSDTHIMPDPAATARGINMTDHLRQVVGAITRLDTQPAHVIVNGDLATDGSPPTPEAYKQFGRLISPMRNSGIRVHLTMGNCDRRRLCIQALADLSPEHPPVEGRWVDIIETEHANWFLLDSLYNTKSTVTEGNLGAPQIRWLAKAIDQHADKPAIVVGHHHLEMNSKRDPIWSKLSGLLDNDAVVDVLRTRRHVKAYICGHTHVWKLGEVDGLHLINLPTTAYIFDPKQPQGWVEGYLAADGIRLTLHTIAANHPLSGQQIRLTWRNDS